MKFLFGLVVAILAGILYVQRIELGGPIFIFILAIVVVCSFAAGWDHD
jgi:hypothetical protein